MDINEIFRRDNVLLSDYASVVFSTKTQKLVTNPLDEVDGQTLFYHCDVVGFKTIEDIIKMLDESELVIVVKGSLKPSPVAEFDFFLRYKKIK